MFKHVPRKTISIYSISYFHLNCIKNHFYIRELQINGMNLFVKDKNEKRRIFSKNLIVF